jgi:hypothetical protein
MASSWIMAARTLANSSSTVFSISVRLARGFRPRQSLISELACRNFLVHSSRSFIFFQPPTSFSLHSLINKNAAHPYESTFLRFVLENFPRLVKCRLTAIALAAHIAGQVG